jgi:hypothetical protein
MRGIFLAAILLAASCASLETVNKTPERDDVAELLVREFECRDTAEKKCAPGEQPRLVKISSINCEALPLRPATRERAHAACAFSGAVVRIDGSAVPFPQMTREFSLIELTPGVRVPERAWTLAPPTFPAKG